MSRERTRTRSSKGAQASFGSTFESNLEQWIDRVTHRVEQAFFGRGSVCVTRKAHKIVVEMKIHQTSTNMLAIRVILNKYNLLKREAEPPSLFVRICTNFHI